MESFGIALNSIFKEGDGDYIILVDYGGENLSVAATCKTLSEAMGKMSKGFYSRAALVKLVRLDVKEVGA